MRKYLDFFNGRRHVHAHVFWGIFVSSMLVSLLLIAIFASQTTNDITEIQRARVRNIADSALSQIDAAVDTLRETHSLVFSSGDVYAYIAHSEQDAPSLDWYYRYRRARDALILIGRGQGRLVFGMSIQKQNRETLPYGTFYALLDPFSLEAGELNRPLMRNGALFFVTLMRSSSVDGAYLMTQVLNGAFDGYYQSLVTRSDAIEILDASQKTISRFSGEGADSGRIYEYAVTSANCGVTVRVRSRVMGFYESLAASAPWLLTSMLCALGVSLALSLGFSARLIKGYRTMQDNIRMVEDARYESVKLIDSQDELGALSVTFARMAGHISSLIRENREREQKKHELDLQVLRAQVSPHFLYNSLNSVRHLAAMQGMDHIEKLTLSIINLLKASLNTDEFMVDVDRELDYVKSYCEICRYQFVNDFDLNIRVHESAQGLKILHMALQPLVENCIIHGFADGRRGEITITVSAEAGVTRVTVEDNGRGMTPEQLSGLLSQEKNTSRMRFSGIGVNNVRERIRLRFGDEYDLKVESEAGKYTRVTFTQPSAGEEGAI